MQRALPLLFLAFVSLLLCSCKKDIFFSNGIVVEEDRKVEGDFRVVELCDNINVKLLHRTDQMTPGHIHVRSNENLMPYLTSEIHGDTLTIRNENILNWIRPYDVTLEMTVYYDSINKIVFNSNGILTTDSITGTIEYNEEGRPYHSLRLFVESGSGDVNLSVQCYQLHTNYDYGTATVKLKGDARIAYTSSSYNCHGPIDATALETNIHFVYAYGTNDISVKAFHEVSATNHNNGSIYYLTYTGLRWNYATQSYDEISCPEVISANGHNIRPIHSDQ